jgi:transcriptional regulator NrdR family protein
MICTHQNSTVTDSRDRQQDEVKKVKSHVLRRRRRKCLDCGVKFTTFELRSEDVLKWESEAEEWERLYRAMEQLFELRDRA